jgi:glycine betaine/proline transport system permease protein
MIWFEKLLIGAPWPIILVVIGSLCWLGARSWKLVAGSIFCFAIIGYFGM